jgi:hypothetical protein
MSEATATISSTIIHLRTVLQPEIPRSPERPERARSSVAAQTQPFGKQQTRMLHFSIPCSLRHRRHESRFRKSTRSIISALGKTTSAATHAPQP